MLDALIREAGVTRLADLTGLDCIGVPVWQATRPFSTALSVHQGKGLTTDAARIGAVMEAIECHHAENWRAADKTRSSWAALPPARRSVAADDFARVRGALSDDRVLAWVLAEPLDGGEPFYVPEACVSLDCTRDLDRVLMIGSSGQAAHFATDDSTLNALLELIERDAAAEWLTRSAIGRAGTEIDIRTVTDDAFRRIANRLAQKSIGLRLYALPAVVPAPVFAVELATFGSYGTRKDRVLGAGCALARDHAILRALLEALQTRCTEIAGSRDTIPIGRAYEFMEPLVRDMSLPARSGWRGHPLRPEHANQPRSLADLIGKLTLAGYRSGRIMLSPAVSSAVTVKAFVPGLAEDRRRRRP